MKAFIVALAVGFLASVSVANAAADDTCPSKKLEHFAKQAQDLRAKIAEKGFTERYQHKAEKLVAKARKCGWVPAPVAKSLVRHGAVVSTTTTVSTGGGGGGGGGRGGGGWNGGGGGHRPGGWNGGGGHWNGGGGHWNGGGWNGGWNHGPNAGEVIGGIVIGNVLSNWLFPQPAPVVVVEEPEPPAGPSVWSPEWLDQCQGKYKTFDAKTGYYTGYDGIQHFCQ